jgi:hypothetical protein
MDECLETANYTIAKESVITVPENQPLFLQDCGWNGSAEVVVAHVAREAGGEESQGSISVN